MSDLLCSPTKMPHCLTILLVLLTIATIFADESSGSSKSVSSADKESSLTVSVDGNDPMRATPIRFHPGNNVKISTPPCDQATTATDYLVNLTETILDLLQGQDHHPSRAPAHIVNHPKDCSEILASGVTVNGVYAIYPDGPGDPFFVSCDMVTDGGGWTVFQRRENGLVDFYLDWSAYKYGFGSVSSEHWLGNNKIYRLSTQKAYELRVDLEDFTGQSRNASYSVFRIGNEDTSYTLNVGGYSGNAGDSFSSKNSYKFSTKDRDNDVAGSSCSIAYRGAWWYVDCHSSNLNGLYLRGETSQYAKGVVWNDWLGYNYSLKKTEMKIRPV